MIDRLSLDVSRHPSFIGCWMLENTSLCDGLMEFFEHNKDAQKPGVTSTRKVQEENKNKKRDYKKSYTYNQKTYIIANINLYSTINIIACVE